MFKEIFENNTNSDYSSVGPNTKETFKAIKNIMKKLSKISKDEDKFDEVMDIIYDFPADKDIQYAVDEIFQGASVEKTLEPALKRAYRKEGTEYQATADTALRILEKIYQKIK